MSQTILSRQEGKAGIITLNRPEAINALTSDMIAQIDAAFSAFMADDDISLVLFEGVGARGFCAGGDVREVRQAVLNNDAEGFAPFFETEYALNLSISKASKPVVALTDGVVMGGGIGLAGHAAYRISTDRGRFAMPEGAIGLHCDVGANALLAKCTRHHALAFLMAGEAVGARDALALGLTDCVIGAQSLEQVRADLIALAQSDDVPHAIAQCMQNHGVESGRTEFIDFADRIAEVFDASSALHVMENLRALGADDAQAKEFMAVLEQRCPTSLAVIFESLEAARNAPDVALVLERDYRLSVWMVQRHDFIEGVRALLVDKDRNPSWDPKLLKDVDLGPINLRVLG